MNKTKQIRCSVVFDSIEKVNPLFSKVKIKIAYTGANRNNSYLTKEAIEKALPTIYNCPIIGEFIETADDFGSHGGKIEITDKGVKYVQTTKPYGVINENSEITWEDTVESDGTINTYLCATGYLWTGRYEELISVINNSKGQSMEIEVASGSFQDINGKNMYVIEDFVFSAFCILGDSTEPCFESADITAYSFNKNEFKEEFTKMLNELKQYFTTQSSTLEVDDNINFNKEGGKSLVDKKLELLKKHNLTEENISFNIQELSLEEIESKIKEHFSILESQKVEELSNALRVEKFRDKWGDERFKYSYVDYKDNMVFAYDVQENWNLYGFAFSMNGDKPIIDFASKARKKFDIVDFVDGESIAFNLFPQEAIDFAVSNKEKEISQKFNDDFEVLKTKASEFESTVETLNTEISNLKSLNEELSNYKNNKEKETHIEVINEVFSQFDDVLKDNQDYIDYKANVEKNVMDYSVETVEEKLNAIFGKLQFSKINKKPKEKVSANIIEGINDEIKSSRYGKYEKYISKE